MKASTRLDALTAQRQDVLTLCAALSSEEWEAPSLAEGWRVRDVIAHLGSVSQLLVTPAAIWAMCGKDVELANDRHVARRAEQPVDAIAEGYAKWSARAAAMLAFAARPPLGAVPLRVAELGWYPMRLTPSMLVFDTYVHLRHDVAPALSRSLPPPTGQALSVVIEWMLAGLEQMQDGEFDRFDGPLVLTLRGAGGGTWSIEPGRRRGLAVRSSGPVDRVAAHITAGAVEFPAWATTRVSWRDCDVAISGDADVATRFLDVLNIV